MKTCLDCGKSKTLDNFYTQGKQGGRTSFCRNCGPARQRKWREANAERYAERQKKYFTDEIKEDRRIKRLLKKYSLTESSFKELFDKFDGCCHICKRHRSEFNIEFAVDHDHRCCGADSSCGNCVRGLLCFNCNHSLGLMKDDPERLRAAAEYLETQLV